jgi:hypothetical protein
MMGTPGILRMRRFRSCAAKVSAPCSRHDTTRHGMSKRQLQHGQLALSHVATMKHRCCVQRSTKQSSAYLRKRCLRTGFEVRGCIACYAGNARPLVLARQPLEPRIPRDAQRHFVLRAQFLKLGHNAIAGRGVRLRGEGSGGFSAIKGMARGLQQT